MGGEKGLKGEEDTLPVTKYRKGSRSKGAERGEIYLFIIWKIIHTWLLPAKGIGAGTPYWK